MYYGQRCQKRHSHALQVMLYLAGDKMHVSAEPKSFDATLLRVNDIETFDTVSSAFYLENDVTIYYNAAHPVQKSKQHTFEFVFEGGTVNLVSGNTLEGVFADGSIKNYGVAGEFSGKLEETLNAIRRGETESVCGILASLPHTMAVDMLNTRIDTLEKLRAKQPYCPVVRKHYTFLALKKSC